MSGASAVVSLVPSATETLIALGVVPVACTRFCEQDGIPTVGGTKDPHVDEIVALAPDLVVVNDEENRREDCNALVGAGLALHSMSPRSVSDVGPAVSTLAERVGCRCRAPFGLGDWHGFVHRSSGRPKGRVVVLIWRRPWMTMTADTYGASLLSVLGWRNAVTEGSTDRYPRDLARSAERAPARPGAAARRALSVRGGMSRRVVAGASRPPASRSSTGRTCSGGGSAPRMRWPACRRRTGSGSTFVAMQRTLFDSDHELFRDSVRAFIAKELVPHHEEWEHAGIVDREVFAQGRRAGLPRHGGPRGVRRRGRRRTSATTS